MQRTGYGLRTVRGKMALGIRVISTSYLPPVKYMKRSLTMRPELTIGVECWWERTSPRTPGSTFCKQPKSYWIFLMLSLREITDLLPIGKRCHVVQTVRSFPIRRSGAHEEYLKATRFESGAQTGIGILIFLLFVGRYPLFGMDTACFKRRPKPAKKRKFGRGAT
jgi:hypothetical protein